MKTGPPARVVVLYIGGFTRSGSTLLAYLLDALDGFRPVGELREVWVKGLLRDNLCSCGEHFSACPFWTSVGERAFGGWDGVDAAELAATSEALGTEVRLLPALLGRRRLQPRLARLGEHAARVYAAIGEVSGCSVVVDSSKHAAYALLLSRETGVRLSVIHLVRDSRGVAFSWTKRDVSKPDVDSKAAVMDSYGVGATALRWSFHNQLFATLRLRGIPITVMRYEQLAAAPAAELEGSLRRLGFGGGVVGGQFASHGVRLSDAHTIGGNPMRFAGRKQAVRLDEEWLSAMPRRARVGVTLLTWPLLLQYGYLGTPSSDGAERATVAAGVPSDS